jgi:hypothetical protein
MEPVVKACLTFLFKNCLTTAADGDFFLDGIPFPDAILFTINAPDAVRAPVITGAAMAAVVAAADAETPNAMSPEIINEMKPPVCLFFVFAL